VKVTQISPRGIAFRVIHSIPTSPLHNKDTFVLTNVMRTLYFIYAFGVQVICLAGTLKLSTNAEVWESEITEKVFS